MSEFTEFYLPIIERLEALNDIRTYLKLWCSKDKNRRIELRFSNAELSKGEFTWWDDRGCVVRHFNFTELSQLTNILEQLNGL